MAEITLHGCRPAPLAHYLKALGVLRLVCEQADPGALGFWRGESFVLRTRLDLEGLLGFFLTRYAPSPVLGPWNGGSGFHPSDNREALTAIQRGPSPRFSAMAQAIGAAQRVLEELGVESKPGDADLKKRVIEGCRAQLPDAALMWLDAALVLTEDGVKYPPLLGTGGNDGRLDFTNNFMQRLVELIDPATGASTRGADTLLRGALLGEATRGLVNVAIGQYFPGAAGGANRTAGFSAAAQVNPWDFVLMMEGALMFAAAAVRRLGSSEPGAMSFPFAVRGSGVGYGSAAASDEGSVRGEIWMPLWPRPTGRAELAALLGEGRVVVGRRPARTGVDFARAVVGLGVDRGLSAFERFTFQERNGQANFAVPLGRFHVHHEARADLLSEIDPWLDDLRQRARADDAPAAVARAVRALEVAIVELCRLGGRARLERVLVSLGACERALSARLRWTNKEDAYPRLRPLAGLSSAWLKGCDDGSPELRLALALAWCPVVRGHLEPVAVSASGAALPRWDEGRQVEQVWREGPLVSNLNALVRRRLIIAQGDGARRFLPRSRVHAHPTDVAAFVAGGLDEARMEALLWGLMLLDPDRDPFELGQVVRPTSPRLPTLSALLTLSLSGGWEEDSHALPLVPEIHRRASLGDGDAASALAARRLRASGVSTRVDHIHQQGRVVQRCAAALAFPLSRQALVSLANLISVPDDKTSDQGA